MMSTSRYNSLWSDVMIEQNGRIPHFRINLYMLLVHNSSQFDLILLHMCLVRLWSHAWLILGR